MLTRCAYVEWREPLVPRNAPTLTEKRAASAALAKHVGGRAELNRRTGQLADEFVSVLNDQLADIRSPLRVDNSAPFDGTLRLRFVGRSRFTDLELHYDDVSFNGFNLHSYCENQIDPPTGRVPPLAEKRGRPAGLPTRRYRRPL